MTTKHIFVERGDPSGYDFDQTDFTTDETWRDLDLSSIVPVGATWVYFRCSVGDSDTALWLMFREKGNSNDIQRATVRTQASNVVQDMQAFVRLDSNRYIQYRGVNDTFTIIQFDVMGWVIPLEETKLVEIPKNVSPALDDVVYTTNGSSDKKVEIADVNMGIVLLEEQTVSGVASIDMESWYSYKYDQYQIELNISVATDNVGLNMRLSTDGGSTYESTGYMGTVFRWYASGSSQDAMSSTAFDFLAGVSTKIGNDSGASTCGFLRLFNAGSTSLYKKILGNISFFNSGATETALDITGRLDNASAVNAFQLYATSGNISGTVRVYGYRRTYTTTTTTTTT